MDSAPHRSAPDNDQILELVEQAFKAGVAAGRSHEANNYSRAADDAQCDVTKTYARAMLYRHWPENEPLYEDKQPRLLRDLRPIIEAAAKTCA